MLEVDEIERAPDFLAGGLSAVKILFAVFHDQPNRLMLSESVHRQFSSSLLDSYHSY